MKIAICDDEAILIAQVEQLLQQSELDKMDTITTFSSGEALLAAYVQKYTFDLIFLDVQMESGINGIKTAHRLREIDDVVMIVFLTSYGQYKDDAFDVSAAQYLMKPINEQRFIRTFFAAANAIWNAIIGLLFMSIKRNILLIQKEMP